MRTYNFKNNSQVLIDYKKATICSIVVAGEELITEQIPFYAVKLRDKDGNSKIITGNEHNFISIEGITAHYTHEEIEVYIDIKQEKDALVWRMSIKNKTEDLLEWAEIMSVGVHGRLQDEAGGKGAIVFPYNEGCLVTDMNKRNTNPFPYIEPEYPSLGKYAIFPNMISSQFLAYIADGKGIYLGMHDAERTTKHIDFRSVDDAIKLQMRAFCDVDYGEDYEMPFDSVMHFFEGEWQDACEIYRQWFYENLPEGLHKIADSKDVPEWYGESPIVVTYPVRGKFDTDIMEPNKLYPYTNAMPYLREIAKETDSKVMTLLMHWEGTAPWAPPYMWPPYGGEKLFGEFVEKVHQEDMLVGLYCSGMGWTQQSNLIDTYNREQEFKEDGLEKIMCSDSDGTIKSAICKEQREGYDICPACEKAKDILVNEFSKLMESGVDYVQGFDQNHGGNSYFCYSREHGHTPAPGKWQAKETLEVMKRIRREDVLLGCESAAAEPFLSHLKFSDNRYELNYYIGLPIPIYSYLYHEYVNNFMGNQICMMLSQEEYNYPYRVAYSFIAGDMLTIVLTDFGEVSYCWGNDCFKAYTDKGQAYEILRNLNSWRQGAGRDFLHLGKMVKPIPIFCGTNSFMGEDGREIIVNEVLTSAYEYNGKRMQFVVNYNSRPIPVTTKVPVNVYKNVEMTDMEQDVSEFEVPALSAVALM